MNLRCIIFFLISTFAFRPDISPISSTGRWWLAFIVSRDALPADWLVALREGFLFLFFLACRRRRRAEVHSRGTSTFLDEIGVSLCHRHLHNRKATIHRWCGSESRPRSGRKKWQMMKYAGVREKRNDICCVISACWLSHFFYEGKI